MTTACLPDEEYARDSDALRKRLQKRCVEMDVYWREPDAHGVTITVDQAVELLEDALGVQVEIDG